MSYDALSCWLRSVDEARMILKIQETQLCETSRSFFQSFRGATSPSIDSSFIPSNTSNSEHLSLTRTNSTQSLTTTSSSTALHPNSSDYQSVCSTSSTSTSGTILLNRYVDSDNSLSQVSNTPLQSISTNSTHSTPPPVIVLYHPATRHRHNNPLNSSSLLFDIYFVISLGTAFSSTFRSPST